MTAASTDSKNCINLKGSAALVSEFFYYGINNILYQRGIYPDEYFTFKDQYGIRMRVADHEAVNSYLKEILSQIREWLEKGQIQRMVLVINNVATQEVLERWDFEIHPDNAQTAASKDSTAAPAPSGKDIALIQREMRDVMRQITACVSFLPMIEHQCAFDVLVYTKKDCEVPEAWDNSAPCFINNCQEVRLKSFSTSVHKVKAAVAYKLGD